MLRRLAKDPIVRLQAGVILGVAIPFFLPWLSWKDLWGWVLLYSEIPLQLVTILAFRYGLRRCESEAERRFWRLWSFAIGAWLVKTLVAIVLEMSSQLGTLADLGLSFGFFFFYLFAALALESRPNLPSGRHSETLRAMERSGTLIFFSGLLLYFSVVPAIYHEDAYANSTLLLYVALDSYLVIRLAGFMRSALDGRWRRVYGFLLFTCCVWWATDTVEMFSWTFELSWIQQVSYFDLIWLVPWATLVLAARVREIPVAESAHARLSTGFPLGPLVVYTVSFPIIHFSLPRLGLGSDELAPMREALALVLTVVMAAMVVIHQELLRVENRRLEAERLETQMQIEHLAFRDPLTGLPNRRLLVDRVVRGMGRARRFNRRLGILLLDIDDFKNVNDSHGHDVGDAVLQQISARLEGCLRAGDTVARLGGDEFVAVLEGLREAADTEQAAEAMKGSLESPYVVEDLNLVLTCTIGSAAFPDDGESLETLLKQADIDMYRRKDERRREAGGPRAID